MQYFKPSGAYFAGDCMPFFHAGVFRLFYLVDENHHQALEGLGGHQWAQASSTDLVHWEHHPLAISITDDREGSICTGSVLFHDGLYYGFYATRMRDWTQHLSLAVSRDGVSFEKTEPNPFASPPPNYDPYHYRDPVVFRDSCDGLFHMLVTACLADYSVPGRGGCLAHLVSADLVAWEVKEPLLIPGLPGVPECPDLFAWNGWYYLIFSNDGIARYRMAREFNGPWILPKVDMLDGPAARVMKTAPFTGGRRIGVAWIGTRENDRDDGSLMFGGNVVFRELVQLDDGSLCMKFPEEMIAGKEPLSNLQLTPLSGGATFEKGRVRIDARQGLGAAVCSGVPQKSKLVMRVAPHPNASGFGLRLCAQSDFDSGYDLHFSPFNRTVHLNEQYIFGVDGLDRAFTLEVVLYDDIIDVCIDGRRTLIDRCPERRGDKVFFYGQDSDVTFEMLEFTTLA